MVNRYGKTQRAHGRQPGALKILQQVRNMTISNDRLPVNSPFTGLLKELHEFLKHKSEERRRGGR